MPYIHKEFSSAEGGNQFLIDRNLKAMWQYMLIAHTSLLDNINEVLTFTCEVTVALF